MLSEIKNTYSILEKKQKIKSFFLVIFILGNVCLEIFCLFLLYDFMRIATTSFTSNNIFERNYYLNILFSYIGVDYNINSLIFLILLLYVLKFFFNLIFNFCQYSFLNLIKVHLNKVLFEGYLNKDYSFHLNNNPVSLIRNTETEVGQFILGCFLQLIFIISESTFIFAIVLSLIFANTKIVIYTITCLFLFGFFYLRIVKPLLISHGNSRVRFSENFLKNLSEGFYGIKSLKLYNAKDFFVKSLNHSARQLANTNIFFSVISQVPKNSLELLIIIVILLFYQSKSGIIEANPEIIVSLGFFVIVSFKMLPSVSKIILALQSLKYNSKAILVIKSELKNINYFKKINKKNYSKTRGQEIDFNHKIILKNIYFKHKETKKPIFKKINLQINKGDKVGIVGESGAGKSTLVDILTGLLDAKNGFVKVDNIKIGKNNKMNWISKIGYVPQKIYLTDDSIINNVAFGQTNIDKSKLKRVLKLVGLDILLKLKNKNLETKLGQEGIRVSGGQIQRIGIARCLYKDPEVLIFDEATSSLDKITEKKIIEVIKKISKSKTLIMISHEYQNLRFCNKIYEIKNGNLKKVK